MAQSSDESETALPMNQPLPLPYGRGSVGERVPGVQSRARQQAATAFMVPMRVQTLEVEAFHEPLKVERRTLSVERWGPTPNAQHSTSKSFWRFMGTMRVRSRWGLPMSLRKPSASDRSGLQKGGWIHYNESHE